MITLTLVCKCESNNSSVSHNKKLVSTVCTYSLVVFAYSRFCIFKDAVARHHDVQVFVGEISVDLRIDCYICPCTTIVNVQCPCNMYQIEISVYGIHIYQ